MDGLWTYRHIIFGSRCSKPSKYSSRAFLGELAPIRPPFGGGRDCTALDAGMARWALSPHPLGTRLRQPHSNALMRNRWRRFIRFPSCISPES